MLTVSQRQARIGLGISVETGGDELQEQQEAGAQPSPNIPF